MSQPISPSSISNERNPYMRIQRALSGGTKVRSRIIERHTYKTDSGQLLDSPVLDRNYNTHKLETIIKTTNTTSNRVVQPNITLTKVGNSSREVDNKVRTEHCDSTTDIIENVNKKDHIIPELLMNILNDHVQLNKFTIKAIRKNKPSESESDSDCQIINVENGDNVSHASNDNDSYSITPVSFNDILTQNYNRIPSSLNNLTSKSVTPNSKVMNWAMQNSSDAVVHVISDSDDENSDSTVCIKKSSMNLMDNNYSSSDVCSETKSMYNLCSDVKKSTPIVTISKVSVTPNVQNKDPIVLINEKYHYIKKHLSNITKTSDYKNPSETCSTIHLEDTPSQSEKDNETTLQMISKLNAPLSPESMRSEFYSYLKINTNPLAQKSEAIVKNRRSVRVKNLILQIQKNNEIRDLQREALMKENEKDKEKNNVRKKYLKYSKPTVVFPPPSIINNKIMNFDDVIEKYFVSEGLTSKTGHKRSVWEKESEKISRKRSVSETESENEKPPKKKYKTKDRNKLIFRKKKRNKLLIKYMNKRQQLEMKKLETNATYVPDLSLRRLRFKPNRIMRNSSIRITRNSLDGHKVRTPKLRKIHKNKFKNSMKRSLESNTSSSPVSSRIESTVSESNNEETDINSRRKRSMSLPTILSQKLTTALQNSIANYENNLKILRQQKSVNTNKIIHSMPISNSNADKTQVKKITVPQEIINNSETANRNNNDSPVCFGFPEDRTSNKILETMQEIVSDLNDEPEYSSSDNLTDKIEINEQSELRSDSDEAAKNDEPELSNSEKTENNDRISEITTPIAEEDDQLLVFDNEEGSTSSDLSEVSSIVEEELPVSEPVVINTDSIKNEAQNDTPNYIPLNQDIKPKSFHRSLMEAGMKRKQNLDTSRTSLFELSDSDSSLLTPKTPDNKKSQAHVIDINKNNGAVFNAYFTNGILIIVQEKLISFWKQTALGNILGVQNMWLPYGNIQRIILDPGCVNRRSSEMVLSTENSIAYIELWTKEHKCVFRECPIADVFATIYYHRGHGVPDKKVLQFENIKGYGDDVRFAVIRSTREIIVSWCDNFSKPMKTSVRSYQLAPDFQTISSVKELKSVSHYISSLHNIHDCDDLILGAGHEQISVWNLRYGYLIITLDFSDNTVQPSIENNTICLYALCDGGFLFLIQQTNVGVLRLVAINGMTHEWKQLHSYQVPDNYKKLLGVIVESGVLMTCYTNGFLCWNMHRGEILAEIDTTNEHIVLPCNKYLVAIDNYKVTVQHIMSYILTHDW